MQTLMSSAEYKIAKARSCITVSDIWCAAARVSKDQDKAYSSGRTPIPEDVATNVRRVVAFVETAAASLLEELRQALPSQNGYAIEIDEVSLGIQIQFPSKKTVKVACCGLDIANLWPVYIADQSTRGEAVFLNTPERPWKRIANNQRRWFLWRGDFVESRSLRRFQSYSNELDERVLMEAFKRYI